MINLLHMDCMDLMSEYEDDYFDLGIIDCPYGLNESGKTNASRGSAGVPSTKFLHKDWDDEPPPIEYFKELERVTKNQIIWGANHFSDRVGRGSPCWIVWDKDNGGSDFADCELAYTSFKTAVRKFKFTWNGMLQGDMKNKEKRIHPTQKPVKLYEWLLTNYAKPGDKILDTHLGSMSIALACHNLGFDLVGCELDEDYYNAGVERYEQHIKQQRLF